jgi:tetratricopeptide (TPR) repeat protein
MPHFGLVLTLSLTCFSPVGADQSKGKYVLPAINGVSIMDDDDKVIDTWKVRVGEVIWSGKEWISVQFHLPGGVLEGYVKKSEAVLLEDATTYYSDKIKADSGNAWARHMRGVAWNLIGNYDEAVKDLTEAIEIDPSPSQYICRGMAWQAKKDYEKSIGDYTAAIRLDSNSAQAFYNRGLVRSIKNDLDKAIEDYTAAIRLEPNFALAYNNRAAAFFIKQQYEKAIKDYDEAIRIDSKWSAAFYNRGNAWFATLDYNKAIEDYTEAIKLDQSPTYRIQRAIALSARRDYDKAIEDYTEAIKLDPQSALAFYNRGLVYSFRNDNEKAIADYDEATRLNPKFAWAFSNRGSAWYVKKDYDKALEDYSEAIRLDPSVATFFFNRGDARSANQKYDDALADYTEAIRLDPKFYRAHNARAWLQATCPNAKYRDGAKAIEDANKACELTKWKNMACIETLAAAHAEKGEFDEAVKWQKKTLENQEFENAFGERSRRRLKMYEGKNRYRDYRE